MPTASLAHMSVRVDGTNQTLLMPKLQYRFRVKVSGFGTSAPQTDLTRQVVDVTRPSVSFTDIPVDVYNSVVHIAGKHSWDPLTLNLRDDANKQVQLLVGQQIQKQFDFYDQSSAYSGQDYKFRMYIEILDGGNGTKAATVLETFEVLGCYIESANYNSLAYSASEPVTITLSIRFDNALQTPRETAGLGVAVQRALGTAITSA